MKALSALLPEAGFITEEGSASYRDEPYCWVIDPLDGTTNYIHDEAPTVSVLLCVTVPNFFWVSFMKFAGMNVFMPGKVGKPL